MDTSALNKKLVIRFIEDGLNGGDLDAIEETVAVDFVSHPVPPGQPSGIDGVKAFAAAQREAAPDWHIEIADVIAEGDRVVVRATGRGTPQQPYFGIPATDHQIEISWIAIYRLEGGKVVERWSEADWLGVQRQLQTSGE